MDVSFITGSDPQTTTSSSGAGYTLVIYGDKPGWELIERWRVREWLPMRLQYIIFIIYTFLKHGVDKILFERRVLNK